MPVRLAEALDMRVLRMTIRQWMIILEENYRHVARYPWLSVEPDPPRPNDPFVHLEDLHNEDVPGLP